MFDGKKFLTDHFHTPQHAVTLLGRYGFPASLAAAEKWFQRGSVPGQWLPVMLCLKEIETGRPVGLAKYLRVGA